MCHHISSAGSRILRKVCHSNRILQHGLGFCAEWPSIARLGFKAEVLVTACVLIFSRGRAVTARISRPLRCCGGIPSFRLPLFTRTAPLSLLPRVLARRWPCLLHLTPCILPRSILARCVGSPRIPRGLALLPLCLAGWRRRTGSQGLRRLRYSTCRLRRRLHHARLGFPSRVGLGGQVFHPLAT